MKLSERLEAMAGKSMFGMEEFRALLREAAELARRVEGAPCAVAGKSPGRFYYAGGCKPVDHGQRVRLVPDSPTPPDPGHEREGRDG